MGTIRVEQTLSDTVRLLASIPSKVNREGRKVVRKNVRAGSTIARRRARSLSGDPHGDTYYKRITDEMTGQLEGEFGPLAGKVPIGGGWRTGSPNTELEQAQDAIGPKFANDAGDMLDGLFW